MSSISETNFQYEIYLNSQSPIFLSKWMPAPEKLAPFVGDQIMLYGDSKIYRIIRTDPPLNEGQQLSLGLAYKIYVEVVTPDVPESDPANYPYEQVYFQTKVF